MGRHSFFSVYSIGYILILNTLICDISDIELQEFGEVAEETKKLRHYQCSKIEDAYYKVTLEIRDVDDVIEHFEFGMTEGFKSFVKKCVKNAENCAGDYLEKYPDLGFLRCDISKM